MTSAGSAEVADPLPPPDRGGSGWGWNLRHLVDSVNPSVDRLAGGPGRTGEVGGDLDQVSLRILEVGGPLTPGAALWAGKEGHATPVQLTVDAVHILHHERHSSLVGAGRRPARMRRTDQLGQARARQEGELGAGHCQLRIPLILETHGQADLVPVKGQSAVEIRHEQDHVSQVTEHWLLLWARCRAGISAVVVRPGPFRLIQVSSATSALDSATRAPLSRLRNL